MTENRDDQKTGFLDTVYGIETQDDTRRLYRDWAETYDDEVLGAGYASPGRVAAAMANAVKDRTAPLLDLGCGTGLSGEAFRQAGFTTVDGTDFSEEMLESAKAKGVYRSLFKGDLSRPIPAEPGDYADIAAVGVFSPSHAPAEMIDQVMDLLPKGGCFGFTLNDHALDEKIYEERTELLVAQGTCEIAFKQYGDHLPERDLKSMVYVLRKL
jgi:predicted TPR repeat methyltransferase